MEAANWARTSSACVFSMDSDIGLDPLKAFIPWSGGGFTSAFGHAIGRVPCAFAFFCSRASKSHLIPLQSASAEWRFWLCQSLRSLQLFDLRLIPSIHYVILYIWLLYSTRLATTRQ